MTTQQLHNTARKHIIMFAAMIDYPKAWIASRAKRTHIYNFLLFDPNRTYYWHNHKMNGKIFLAAGDCDVVNVFLNGDFCSEYISGFIKELCWSDGKKFHSFILTHKHLILSNIGDVFGKPDIDNYSGEQMKVLAFKNGETLLKYTDTDRNISEYYIYEM
jgi:hypothetical protein